VLSNSEQLSFCRSAAQLIDREDAFSDHLSRFARSARSVHR